MPREREPLGGDGGAGDLPAQGLEPIAIAGRDADASVEREAIDAGAELSGDEAHLAPGNPAKGQYVKLSAFYATALVGVS